MRGGREREGRGGRGEGREGGDMRDGEKKGKGRQRD